MLALQCNFFFYLRRQAHFNNVIECVAYQSYQGSSEALTDQQLEENPFGTGQKAKPFGGAGKSRIEVKRPDCTCFCSGSDNCSHFIEENDEILVAGFICLKGHIVVDIPGVCLKVIKATLFWSYAKAKDHKF